MENNPRVKKIGSYLCYKAIDVESDNQLKKPIAWFSPLIPVNFGPKEYIGLPGLVLEVEMAGSTITATKIILNPIEEITNVSFSCFFGTNNTNLPSELVIDPMVVFCT